MKPGLFKYLSHEVEYILIATITLIILSIIVFPLFIALIPIAIIIGCSSIWKFDHKEN